MKLYTQTAKVCKAKKHLFVRSCVEMFPGEKVNPGLLTNQNDVGN